MRALNAAAFVVALVLSGCGSSPEHGTRARSGAMVSDQNQDGGTAGFAFLPPLVEASATSGEFDADLPVTVSIDEIDAASAIVSNVATFTRSSGAGSEVVRVEDDLYVVNWHTGRFDLAAEKTYRIRVLVPGRELGYADVDVVGAGKELRGAYVGLRLGATLPIKFRIDKAIAPPDGCTAATSDVATGTSVSMVEGQSYNETRAVDVTVLGSSARVVEKMVLRGLNVGGTSTTAVVAARIYDSSQALVGSSAVAVAAGWSQTVEVPVSAILAAGQTYRLGFSVETSPLWQGSGSFFIPSGLGYDDGSGVFRINSAWSGVVDAYPANGNMFVPQVTIATRCP